VFQASEGGSVSVGRRKFQSKIGGSGATPTPPPQIKLEAAPRAIAGNGTERSSRVRAGGVTPLASPTVASREIVLSKTSLTGICLITFACGIVTTVMVDRARTRGSDRDVAAHEPDPAPARTAPEQVAPSPLAPVAPLPAAPVPAPSASSAAEAVVVQMPNLETTKSSSSLALRGPALAASHPRLVAPAPATSAKSKPVVAVGPAVAAKTKPAPAVLAVATTKPTPAIVAPAKTKPTPTVVAAAKAKPTPALAATKATPTKATPTKATPTKATATRTKAPTASPVAAKAKPAGPGPSAAMAKKTKSSDPLGPPTEWVDPFTQ
jgi:hypothetical protein